MFTGIIESVGEILEVKEEGTNVHFLVRSEISNELKVDQSVSHEGVCLTVTELTENGHWVTAVEETMNKTNLSSWEVNKLVNLERCMKADGRFDGHIVQGHVDTTGIVKEVDQKEGSWIFTFEVDNTDLMVEKGSICINGTSLTCFDVTDRSFQITIIPFTFEHTTFQELKSNDNVNLELDILSKYIQKMTRINP